MTMSAIALGAMAAGTLALALFVTLAVVIAIADT